MRVMVMAFASLVIFAALSVQAALIPNKGSPVELGAAPPVELVAQACVRLGPLAGPLGLLALGRLRS
jgi:hypothetical protein